MKTVIVAMIGISVVMLAVVIQGSVNMDSKYQHDLGVSLTRAMRQTMKQLEKEIAEANKQSMMKRYQLYGTKASKLADKSQKNTGKGERK